MGRPIGPDLRIRALNGRGVVVVPRSGDRGRQQQNWAYNVNPLTWTHGIRSTYNSGCRCDLCRDAEAAYSRQRYALRRARSAA